MPGSNANSLLLLTAMVFFSFCIKSQILAQFHMLEMDGPNLPYETVYQVLLVLAVLLAPVLGTLLANLLGPIRLIRAANLLAVVAMAWMKSTSSEDSPVGNFLILTLVSFFVNASTPALAALFLACGDDRRVCIQERTLLTLQCLLYQAVTAIAQLLGALPSVAQVFVPKFFPEYVSLAAGGLLSMCSLFLSSGREPRSVAGTVGWTWINRWCQMALFVLLFRYMIGTSIITSGAELLHYVHVRNASHNMSSNVILFYGLISPLVYLTGHGISCCLIAILVLAGRCGLSGEAGRRLRVRAGVALELTLQFTFSGVYIMFTYVRPPDSGSAVLASVIFSLGQGMCSALIIGAMLELQAASAPADIRIAPLCAGIAAWDAALMLEIFVYYKLLKKLNPSNFYIHYLVSIVSLIVAALQLNVQALPQAARMEATVEALARIREERERALVDPATGGDNDNNSSQNI